jgi:hypothetical protein
MYLNLTGTVVRLFLKKMAAKFSRRMLLVGLFMRIEFFLTIAQIFPE